MGIGSNPMFIRKAVEDTGLFDVSFLRHQDTEDVIRILRNFKVAVVDKILIKKFGSGHPNRPSVEKHIEVQKHFTNNFDLDMKKYSTEEQNEITITNYALLQWMYEIGRKQIKS